MLNLLSMIQFAINELKYQGRIEFLCNQVSII